MAVYCADFVSDQIRPTTREGEWLFLAVHTE